MPNQPPDPGLPPPAGQGAGARVLLLAPTGTDAAAALAVFAEAGIDAAACDDVDALVSAAAAGGGAGALVIAVEALAGGRHASLSDMLARQPEWSDIPLVLMTGRGGGDEHGQDGLREIFSGRAGVTLLERPFRAYTLVSVVRAALRARRRQYEIRDLLAQRARLLAEAQAARGRAEAQAAAMAELARSEKRAREEAEEASRVKDEFLATLSHELRTPLNAMLGWAQLLNGNGVGDDDYREGIEAIERNTRVQAQLIDDLLDVSRIVSGKIRLDCRAVPLGAVVEDALAVAAPAARAKGVRLLCHDAGDGGADAPPLVWGDPTRLQQVFWNLLTNAIKFTPAGGRVDVRLGLAPGGAAAEVAVVDTGIGMKRELLSVVFDRFRQADASTTRAHGGLGLGLSIVRHVVEMHGGAVRAESDGEGCGSCFVVTLPLHRPAAAESDAGRTAAATAAAAPPPPPPLHDPGGEDRPTAAAAAAAAAAGQPHLDGLRVLVVDDQRDALLLLQRALARYRAGVAVAGSVGEALSLLPTFRPHAIVSDIGMPGEDGYDLIRQVRADPRTRDTPAIALTAFVRPEDRGAALRAGYQAHLAKPVEVGELARLIASLTEHVGR